MDQLTAYRILQLMPGSTRREIREAYARLAKEYHPEEHPKEFNQIQEAYQLLTGRGENWSSDAVDDWFSDGEKTESEWESEETCESDTRWKEEEEQEESEESEEAFDEDFEESDATEESWKRTEKDAEDLQENEKSEAQQKKETLEQERKNTEAYQDISHWEFRFDAFEEAERREQWKREAETQRRKMDWQREQEKLRKQTRRAIRDSLYELELILEDKRRRNRTELYEPFFFRRENKAVMLREAYVSGLIDLLEKYPVKRKVYLTLQKIYSGSGAESAKVLIRYLEQKNKKETPNVWGAAAFAAIGIGQLQGICGEEWKSSFSTMLMLIVVILGLEYIRRSSNTLQRGNFSDLDCRDPVLAVVSGIDYDNIRQFVLGCRHRNFSCGNGLVRIYHLDGDSWNQGDCAEDKEPAITGYKKQKGK